MTFTFRPAVREDTPLIIGIAGPTKSGKTKSALRVATGMARGGVIAMICSEGARGHQYADQYKYVACDIEAPFSPERYIEAVIAAKKLDPAVLVIDSASHMHDGPGGLLEMHDDELDRMAGKTDYKKRDRMNFAAWIKPKRVENEFIYALLGLDLPVILCFRAKEKLKIVPGKDPINLGWRPIASDRVEFETLFTLVLPPHSKGVPDLEQSDMREPFDQIVPKDRALDEALGERLAAWAAGRPATTSAPRETAETARSSGAPSAPPSSSPGAEPARVTAEQLADLRKLVKEHGASEARLLAAGTLDKLEDLWQSDLERAIAWVKRHPKPGVDEASTILKIERAKTRDEAALVLDSVRSEPFYPKASEAFTNSWAQRP